MMLKSNFKLLVMLNKLVGGEGISNKQLLLIT